MEHQQQSEALATVEPTTLARADELSVEAIVSRVKKVHEVQRAVMKEGVHYGKVPGVDKPTLLKPGAEILGMVFRLDPQFEVTEQIREGSHLTVTIKCTLYHIPTGARLGSGMGSCSTHESKYAYRKGERKCPECGKATIIKGKEQYGGGWLCFAKKGGCGAKFPDNAPAITEQVVGRVANEDVADVHNTVLKMAIKRAHVAAILFVTCASEIFTQDVEDMNLGGEEPAQDERKPPARKNNGPAGAADEAASLIAAYSDCTDGDVYRGLEDRRRAMWGRANPEQKKKLKAAQEAAQQRVLDNMPAPRSAEEDERDAIESEVA
jgi:hypothetical protein